MWYVIFLKANLLFDTSEHSSQFGEGMWLKEACTSKGIESYEHVNVQVSMAEFQSYSRLETSFFEEFWYQQKSRAHLCCVSEIPVTPSPFAWQICWPLLVYPDGFVVTNIPMFFPQENPPWMVWHKELYSVYSVYIRFTTSLFERKHCSSPA